MVKEMLNQLKKKLSSRKGYKGINDLTTIDAVMPSFNLWVTHHDMRLFMSHFFQQIWRDHEGSDIFQVSCLPYCIAKYKVFHV